MTRSVVSRGRSAGTGSRCGTSRVVAANSCRWKMQTLKTQENANAKNNRKKQTLKTLEKKKKKKRKVNAENIRKTKVLVTTEGFMSDVRSCSASARQLSGLPTVAGTDRCNSLICISSKTPPYLVMTDQSASRTASVPIYSPIITAFKIPTATAPKFFSPNSSAPCSLKLVAEHPNKPTLCHSQMFCRYFSKQLSRQNRFCNDD